MSIKSFFFFLIFSVLAATTFAQSIAVTGPWRKGPTYNERIEKRLFDISEQYRAYAPIPRLALSDTGYPADAKEFDQLDGNAVVLITALSQTENELPLKRVFIAANGKEIELALIRSFTSKIVDVKSQVAVVLGVNRVDALYLMPVYLRFTKADLKIEFANVSKPMTVNSFDGVIPPSLITLPNKEPNGKGPDKKALDVFLQREYPTMFAAGPDK